jgi:hypothetical protein
MTTAVAQKHSLLQRSLRQTDLSCVPEGIHDIKMIYQFVKDEYPRLCDDTVLCSDTCKCGAESPEWKHRVRTVISAMKGKGNIDKDGLDKGYWRFTLRIKTRFAEQIFILDPGCAARSIWFPPNKRNPHVLFMDKRIEKEGQTSAPNGIWPIIQQKGWSCEPDMIGDWRNMPQFDDETFYHIVWDPPHKLKSDTGLITMKYGALTPEWEEDLLAGFNELWRVLKPGGTLNFKWADLDVQLSKVLSIFPVDPMYGVRTKKGVNEGGTYWISYVKIPE